MNYTEVSLIFPPEWSNQNIEILIAFLADKGFDAFSEHENGINAYIPSNLFDNNFLNDLPVSLKALPAPVFNVDDLPDCNWNQVWESNFNPVVIADKLSVRASFHNKPDKVDYDIIINPKMSFGTGHHETTALVAEIMLNHNLSDLNVLDMGCGTGILAILAKMKGAAVVWAIDNDEWAYHNCIENCDANNCSNIKVLLGDAAVIPDLKFDFIIANINRNILIEDMNKYVDVLNSSGVIVFSGFYNFDFKFIDEKAKSLNLKPNSFIEKNKWVACSYINSK